jgi:methylenetetrahydrofolate dehydrogenase (NADP+)/methenyltetrahydrofolate cyclohydrolase
MTLLYGKLVADEITAKTKKLIESMGITPGLAVILVGENNASHLYVKLKEKAAQGVGIKFEKFLFDTTVEKEELISLINTLNNRSDINGIIVQLPLPEGLNTGEIISQINPQKDADGFHEVTLKNFLNGDKEKCPVFPRAIIELLRSSGENNNGKNGVVLVNSDIFGRIMKQAIFNEGVQADYILFKNIEDNKEKIKEAEIVITVCGVSNLIKPEMLNENAIVIDGGISYLDGNVMGDVERISVEQKVKFLSPVPGGVGPVTVATLLARVAEMAEKGRFDL